jgi:outer membrane protein assembly factor BamB
MAVSSTSLGAALLGSLLLINASTKSPVGWRTDGTGRYAGVEPPTEWGEDKNVLWKVKLPGRSQGSPILVGERLFVASDPAELICLNPADGEVLWRRSSTPEDIYGAEKAEKTAAEYARLRDQRRNLQRDHGKAERVVRDARRVAVAAGPGFVAAAQADAAKQQELREQMEAVQKEHQELMRRAPQPPSYADGETTNSAATPISDGNYVYAVFGNGIVCCCTVKGERRWIKFLETPGIVFGHSSSPALIDGKLIVHLNDLFGIEAATGEVAWRVPLTARHASPMALRVGETPVVVSPAGAVVRVADGQVLLKNGALGASECTPVLHEGVLYAVPGGARALRLVPAGEDAVKLEKLWECRTAGDRRTPSPVLLEGLLYAVTTGGMLEVIDAASGEEVYRRRLGISNLYSSITEAGGKLYISDTRGTTIVIAPGREYREVARNKLEGFGSSPVFSGRRMFVRTRQHLYCIGR